MIGEHREGLEAAYVITATVIASLGVTSAQNYVCEQPVPDASGCS